MASGGGPSLDGKRWINCRKGFFLPVQVLSRFFRRLFLAEMHKAFNAGSLVFCGDLAKLAHPVIFARQLDALRRLDWVVYAKPPFGGPEQVLAYLGRYTHRVAIANSRLVALDEGSVRFAWKDYRHGSHIKVMALEAASSSAASSSTRSRANMRNRLMRCRSETAARTSVARWRCAAWRRRSLDRERSRAR